MTTPKDIVLSACRKLMEPIIGILLRNGITHKELAIICKQLYVKVASQEFGIRGRQTNLSRVALLTGIDRKEVARIKETQEHNIVSDDNQKSQDRLTRVLSGWHQDPDFLEAEGKPSILSLDDNTPNFAQLARRYGGDMPAITLLKELKRHGTVEETDAGELRVLKRYFIPAQSDPSALLRAGNVLHDLGSALEHNLYKANTSKKIPLRFERRATNTEMSPNVAAAFRAFVDKEGQAFLEKIDAWLTEHESSSSPTSDNRIKMRLGVGTYLIEEVIAQDPKADAGEQQ
jgi:hypothetical protein